MLITLQKIYRFLNLDLKKLDLKKFEKMDMDKKNGF